MPRKFLQFSNYLGYPSGNDRHRSGCSDCRGCSDRDLIPSAWFCATNNKATNTPKQKSIYVLLRRIGQGDTMPRTRRSLENDLLRVKDAPAPGYARSIKKRAFTGMIDRKIARISAALRRLAAKPRNNVRVGGAEKSSPLYGLHSLATNRVYGNQLVYSYRSVDRSSYLTVFKSDRSVSRFYLDVCTMSYSPIFCSLTTQRNTEIKDQGSSTK